MSWSDKKKAENKKVVKSKEIKEVECHSIANPDAPVSSIPSMSFQRNQYEKDIFKVASAKAGVSVNAFLRMAGRFIPVGTGNTPITC